MEKKYMKILKDAYISISLTNSLRKIVFLFYSDYHSLNPQKYFDLHSETQT